MNIFYFLCASFFSFLTILHAAGPEKSDCLEKEKALVSLETVEDYLSKARDTYPSCDEDSNSTNQSECSGKKPLAYIEISRKLISDVRENFPTCIGPNVKVHHDKPRDCSEILVSGRNESGVYTIWQSESNTAGKPLKVYCDMETDGGRWTLIQRRGKFPVQQDFNQDWETYKNGFGNITEEFWLGNENIRVLCHKGCEIRFDLTYSDGREEIGYYKLFKLSGSNYTLHITNFVYNGYTADAMKYINNEDFSTKDKGNTMEARERQSGWWYDGDMKACNLNGIYHPGKNGDRNIFWYSFWSNEILTGVEIKVRPK